MSFIQSPNWHFSFSFLGPFFFHSKRNRTDRKSSAVWAAGDVCHYARSTWSRNGRAVGYFFFIFAIFFLFIFTWFFGRPGWAKASIFLCSLLVLFSFYPPVPRPAVISNGGWERPGVVHRRSWFAVTTQSSLILDRITLHKALCIRPRLLPVDVLHLFLVIRRKKRARNKIFIRFKRIFEKRFGPCFYFWIAVDWVMMASSDLMTQRTWPTFVSV